MRPCRGKGVWDGHVDERIDVNQQRTLADNKNYRSNQSPRPEQGPAITGLERVTLIPRPADPRRLDESDRTGLSAVGAGGRLAGVQQDKNMQRYG
jgi:hypothetical protein